METHPIRHPLLTALSLALAVAAAAPLAAQDEEEELVDPYTENDPEALAAAGYEDFGRFRFADGHATVDVEEALAGPRIRWVETPHFRIGCSLPAYRVDLNSRVEKEKIAEELKRLRERLPEVPRKARELDPWLRLHLYAMRAEELYARIEALLGVEDGDFPTGPGQLVDGKYMGQGPYLGMQSKFTILLFEKESSLGRYRDRFTGNPGAGPVRHMFPGTGTLLFACAQESSGLSSDTTMHCLMVYNLAMNLLAGYKYYGHELPCWFPNGLAHWYARSLDERSNYFTEDRIYSRDDKNVWNWAPRVRARVGHEYFPSMRELGAWSDALALKYTDHMMCWARVDFLMQEKREGIATYLDMMKGKIVEQGAPTREDVLARQEEALQAAWGYDAASFDQEWSAWILEHYPEK